jgi:hypothetical protein
MRIRAIITALTLLSTSFVLSGCLSEVGTEQEPAPETETIGTTQEELLTTCFDGCCGWDDDLNCTGECSWCIVGPGW